VTRTWSGGGLIYDSIAICLKLTKIVTNYFFSVNISDDFSSVKNVQLLQEKCPQDSFSTSCRDFPLSLLVQYLQHQQMRRYSDVAEKLLERGPLVCEGVCW